MSDTSLRELYEEHLQERKRDITSSTPAMFTKAPPRSSMSYDYYAEILGLAPERLKALPLKAIEALHDGLVFLLKKMKEDQILRQRFRKFINDEFKKAEEEANEAPVKEEVEIEDEEVLTELVKAQKFNWKRLLDIDEKKVFDPIFVGILNSFDLTDQLSRIQKIGVMVFLKKLASLAENNPQIAQALNRIIRFENIESQNTFREEFGFDKYKTIVEGLTDSEVSPTSLLTDLGIGTEDENAKNNLAKVIFSYDTKFQERNAGKDITWKVVEAAFKHNANYLKELIKYILANKKDEFINKLTTVTKKPLEQLKAVLA